ncbi:Ancient ubiquitous protein 1 [Plakobranchus ocellatus]|uniref:Ancient ubiquitous protein 1 n=1 Tax=Plakobranchus ocellatus TaxID=259542 RepID=A0AAV3XYS9_9GAST|nr:Ancient ubiquitous protein 1 [Plakobranchus ocellatus]
MTQIFNSGARKDIKHIINFERLTSYGLIAPLVLYLPFGLALALIRCFIFLHACLLFFLLPNGFFLKRGILRVMLTVIGLPIATQGEPRVNDKKRIVISNHITNLDPFILTLLHPHVLAIEFPSLLHLKNMPSKRIEIPSDKDYSEAIKILKEKLNGCAEPVLFFPEKVKTNGTGCLKFSHLPFELDLPIQPVTIQAKRFLFNVNISTFSSSIFEDFLWCLILPLTLFSVKYLPVTEKKKDETHEEFASRVQVNMAKSLSLQALSYTYTDISQYIKERERAKVKTSSSEKQVKDISEKNQRSELLDASEFQKMVLQVKDVLPDTPVAYIESELRKTCDVDTTITNILERKSETSSETAENTGLSLRSLSEGQSFKACKFGTTAKARQLSFAERKQAMLEAARLKYRIKHGL